MWDWNSGVEWFGLPAMRIFTLIFLGLILNGLISLALGLKDSRKRRPDSAENRPAPGAITAERLARGDIDKREYTGRIAALRSASAPQTKDRKAW
jgi:uncharacterized membrane protein